MMKLIMFIYQARAEPHGQVSVSRLVKSKIKKSTASEATRQCILLPPFINHNIKAVCSPKGIMLLFYFLLNCRWFEKDDGWFRNSGIGTNIFVKDWFCSHKEGLAISAIFSPPTVAHYLPWRVPCWGGYVLFLLWNLLSHPLTYITSVIRMVLLLLCSGSFGLVRCILKTITNFVKNID